MSDEDVLNYCAWLNRDVAVYSDKVELNLFAGVGHGLSKGNATTAAAWQRWYVGCVATATVRFKDNSELHHSLLAT